MAFRKFEFETVWVLVEFETVWRTKTVWQIYRLWHQIQTNGSIKSGVVQTYASNVNNIHGRSRYGHWWYHGQWTLPQDQLGHSSRQSLS
jgi:hypothetical protein